MGYQNVSNTTKLLAASFLGLSNRKDPLAENSRYFRAARNYMLDDEGKAQVRQGLTEIADADYFYVTKNKQRAFVIASQTLYELEPASDTLVLLQSGIGEAPYLMADAGHNQVFVSTATNTYMVRGGTVKQWGIPAPAGFTIEVGTGGSFVEGSYRVGIAAHRDGEVSGCIDVQEISLPSEGMFTISGLSAFADDILVLLSPKDGAHLYWAFITGNDTITVSSFAQDQLSRPFGYVACFPPPIGTNIAYHDARVYVSVYDKDQRYSEIYGSLPNAYGHFRLDDPADIAVYDEITLLATSPAGLVIGTPAEIQIHREGTRPQVFNYGAVPGAGFDYDRDGDLYFTSYLGIRRVTERGMDDPNEGLYIADNGKLCGGGYVEEKGIRQFISTILESDIVYENPYTPITPTIFDHT